MAGTYSQVYLQIIFAVQGRHALINPAWEVELYKYMSGIISAKRHKPIIVNGHRDHVHLFVGQKPYMSTSDLVKEVKTSSTRFINDRNFIQGKFSWQEGFGVFSYSQSDIDNVYKYVLNQHEHHRIKTFKEEYINFLNEFQVPFEERFLFDWLD